MTVVCQELFQTPSVRHLATGLDPMVWYAFISGEWRRWWFVVRLISNICTHFCFLHSQDTLLYIFVRVVWVHLGSSCALCSSLNKIPDVDDKTLLNTHPLSNLYLLLPHRYVVGKAHDHHSE